MDSFQIKKLLPILMTALVWDINFRLTYKNNDGHMDLGSYPSVKFDSIVIMIKNNACCIIFLPIYIISKKLNYSHKESNEIESEKTMKTKYVA